MSNLDALRWDASAETRHRGLWRGDERLGRVLASRLAQQHRYTGFDIRPQRKSVIELDLRAALPARPFDVVCCLGLLEYIEPLDTFLARLAVRYPALILSYTVFICVPLSRRRRPSRGWLTDYTKAGLEQELEAAGLAVREVVMTNQQRTCLWLASITADVENQGLSPYGVPVVTASRSDADGLG